MQPELLDDRVLVKPVDPPKQSKGGILLPENAKTTSKRGVVLKTGPGRYSEAEERRLTLTVQPGDTVLYSNYAGAEIDIEGSEFKIIRESDVLARFPGAQA